MNKRITEAFAHGKAFIPFITCGDPSLEVTEQLVYALEEAGADLIELGIPFSDPTAEGPVIQAANVRALSGGVTTDKIFEMVEAVAVRNQKTALDYYYDLLALKEPPMRILYLLTRQFKLLLEVKDLAGKRYDKAAIAKTVGLHPFVAGKYMQQCRTFEKKELRSILEDAVDTEELVKTGRLNDVMSVELFIVKYSAA